MNILAVIEENLKEIMSPFLKNISLQVGRLTPGIEIMLLVKEVVRPRNIENHSHIRAYDRFPAKSIRKEIGNSNSKVNLRTFIMNKEGSL